MNTSGDIPVEQFPDPRGPGARTTLGQRIFLARLEASTQRSERVSQEQIGELVGHQLGKTRPITAATISRWESDESTPDLATIAALAAVCHVDPGWLGFGSLSLSPSPKELAHRPVPGLDDAQEHQVSVERMLNDFMQERLFKQHYAWLLQLGKEVRQLNQSIDD